MNDAGQLGEVWVRLAAFAGVFAVMAVLELWRPKRVLTAAKSQRWMTNLSIVALDSMIVRLMAMLSVPLAAVAAAHFAEQRGVGLFNWLSWPQWIELILALAILDFAIWLQHVAAHKIPVLWRVHQMHHADTDIDVTTAIRFHPVEIALSMFWKIVWVVSLGISPLAIVLFEIILNGGAMFNHANVDLPPALDGLLRKIFVTPDMHRVHHSILSREHDSNYGFNLSVWDRLFGTYTEAPELGHESMTIGLACYRSAAPARLGWCLSLPFRPQPGDE